MKLAQAQQQFIASWGAFGTYWGINRTMAQIHALMLISPEPVSQDDLMDQLSISRGNANMNIRELISWGLVERITITGERREFFTAEKDIWKVGRLILEQRKKRELDPMLKMLEQVDQIDDDKKSPAAKQFKETIGNIKRVSGQADKMLTTISKAEENWFGSLMLKFFK